MFFIITGVVVLFLTYIIWKDPSIIHKSISYSYYEDRETAVIWGSFAGITGMMIAFAFPSIITLIAGICLALVPIFGNFQKKPITYIHYGLALTFYVLMLFYTGSFVSALPYAIISLVMLYKKRHTVSTFMIEVLGIIVILVQLYLKIYMGITIGLF